MGEFVSAAAADAAGFSSRHNDHAVEITGTIIDLWVEPDNRVFATLGTGIEDTAPVYCDFAQDKPWQRVTPGQEITVNARCVVDASNAIALRQAVILRAGQPVIERISAEDLTRQFAADPDTATGKYAGRYLVVYGENNGYGTSPNGDAGNSIAGAAGLNVHCNTGNGPAYEALLHRGQLFAPMAMLGKVVELRAGARNVEMTGCLPMPLPGK